MEDDDGIISRFIQLRKEFGPSQAKFGKKLGVSYAAVSLIEKGKTTINEKHIKLIAGVLGINQEWLRSGKGPMYDELSPEEKAVLDIYKQLSPSGRKLVMEYANLLIKSKL